MSDSYPFLHLSRRLCLPYGDVLTYADYLAGRRDLATLEVCRRLADDMVAVVHITKAFAIEKNRRECHIEQLDLGGMWPLSQPKGTGADKGSNSCKG